MTPEQLAETLASALQAKLRRVAMSRTDATITIGSVVLTVEPGRVAAVDGGANADYRWPSAGAPPIDNIVNWMVAAIKMFAATRATMTNWRP